MSQICCPARGLAADGGSGEASLPHKKQCQHGQDGAPPYGLSPRRGVDELRGLKIPGHRDHKARADPEKSQGYDKAEWQAPPDYFTRHSLQVVQPRYRGE